jgi:hypothetical protein
MFDAHPHSPLSSAIAGAAVVRVGGTLAIAGMPGMAQRTAAFPSRRGVLR